MPSEAFRVPHVLRGDLRGQTVGLRCGKGEPVILIHGVGMAAEVWQPQVDALSAQAEVIAYDMLGHGGSSLPPESPALGDYADQLLAVMDGLGLQQAHVVGHSMGALIALEFALRHPDRVRSVVALNAVYCRAPEQRAAVEARAANLSTTVDAKALDATIARWFGDPIPVDLIDAAKTARRMLGSVSPTGYQRTYTLFARADDAHRDRLAELRVPALFMTGEGDPNSTPAMSRAMAEAAPHGRCEILQSQRHMMTLTAAGGVNRRLLDFFSAATPIDPKALRRAFGAFATGVTVVTTAQEDGVPRGFTANSFTSVSLDPPLVLVCLAKTASSYPVFSNAAGFAVNVLAESQRDVSGLFASKAADKFDRVAWRRSAGGRPVIEGAAAWLDCVMHEVVDAGDHAILIGRVVAFGDGTDNPLGYCRGAYVTFSLSQAALGAEARTKVGAILEGEGGLLFVAGADGRLSVPEGVSLEPESDPASLHGRLKRLGVTAQLGFLFAVFEDPKSGAGAVSVYYRGTFTAKAAMDPNLRVIPMQEIPWASLRDEATRTMLQRYVRERSEDIFGIYVGDTERGTVQPLGRPAPGSTAAI
jgi:flavin reductase (DIM6/NTAB) family NADH-FMN oxidoreductase RutF/pimeloyl-ACP methyl ester carboxylesterase